MLPLLAVADSVAALVDRGPLYVNEDGRTVTDWHGSSVIGHVIRASRVKLPQWSPIHGAYITHYRVRIAGRTYWGRSSAGMLIRLHACKEQSVSLIYTYRGESVTRHYSRRWDAHRAIARLRVQHPGIAAYWVMGEAK